MTATLSSTAFRLLPDLALWCTEVGEVEVMIEGGVDGPNPERLKWAQQALADLPTIERHGREYLRLFIDPAHIAARDQWRLESVEFGLNPDDLPSAFALLYRLEGDQYGLWWVQFGFAGPPLERFFPNEFGRKQE
jgi:hypothetical protein